MVHSKQTVEKVVVDINSSANDSSSQLIGETNNVFLLDTFSGEVSIKDLSDLDPEIHQSYEMNIQVLLKNGITFSTPFTLAINPNPPVGLIKDINLLSDVVPENISENGIAVGITAYAEDINNNVSYSLSDNAGGRFTIEQTSGEVSVADFTLFGRDELLKHKIVVEALSEDGSKQSKYFDITVLNQTENNISIVTNFTTLFDWNMGNGHEFLGWNWLDDIAYGNPGWLLSEEGPLEGGKQYSWGWGVRSFNKGDYGKKNTALIDVQNRAPSTNYGGSLKVTETDDSTDHRSTWWLWYDGEPLSERGITNSNTDRMDFYLKAEGLNAFKDDGGKQSIYTNFHVGTYLCWDTEAPSYGTGDGCPYEGPGNQHYYHYLGISPGAWVHVLLDQYPQHIRGKTRPLTNNPTWDLYNKNYFAQLSRFYFEIRAKQNQKTNFRVDELKFYSSKDMVEPSQNEQSISSLWVGYWHEKNVWEIGFHDKSHTTYNDDNNSTFEIRWSTTPITNANFEQAALIEPMFYNGAKYAGQNAEHLIRRPNGWSSNVWTRFTLPGDIEQNYLKIFFAVKDVSIAGEHIGTSWPYNKGDGHDAPTDNIKIIDYYLRQPDH
jgi:hypothetical protein